MNSEPPGFYGKIPSRGDFIGRRVPAALSTPWDDWLGLLTLAVREAAGDDWPEAWLTAPLWHFALGAALAPPQGAAGVLIASVDRVGRMFPFTILGPSAGIPEEAWSAAIEALILEALDDACDPDALDAALLQQGAPVDPSPIAPTQSVWWTQGSDRLPPTRHIVEGLPSRALATAMVLGAEAPPSS